MDTNPPPRFRENSSFSLPASSRWRDENLMHPGRYRSVLRSNEFYFSNLREIVRKQVCVEDVNCLKVLPNGLLSSGHGGYVCIRNSHTLEKLSNLDVRIGNIVTQPHSLEIIDHESLAVSDGRGSIYSWNFETNQAEIVERLFEGTRPIVHQLTILGSERDTLFACSTKGFLTAFDLRDRQAMIRIQVCDTALTAIARSTFYIATGGIDGILRIYDRRMFDNNSLPCQLIDPPDRITITDCCISDSEELLSLYGQNGYYLEHIRSNTFYALGNINLAIPDVKLEGLQFVGKHCIVCPNLETNLPVFSRITKEAVFSYHLQGNFQPRILDYNHEVGLLAIASGVNLMTMAGPDHQ